jgi:hydrocephalus-inducing protein
VFSAYSVVPLKNMNFGPIQFNETKTRTFEIKNEGLFEFNYTIFDNDNEEFRKELLENIRKERETKLEAASNIASGVVTDPKKGGAKKDVKEVKK